MDEFEELESLSGVVLVKAGQRLRVSSIDVDAVEVQEGAVLALTEPVVLTGPLTLNGSIKTTARLHDAESLSKLALALEDSDDLEHLSRPLLDTLQQLTGLSSAYLTTIHNDTQDIRFAANARQDFRIEEGLTVDWNDSLCKRSLDRDVPFTTEASTLWPDSAAARALGVETYVSVPVRTSDGQVWGTLCAADDERAEGVSQHLPTMKLFARLIGAEVEREAALQQAKREAMTDSLTRCASRRAVRPWLTQAFAQCGQDSTVLLMFADLDRFKAINDTYGHEAGDAALVAVGERLRNAVRTEDLVARLGGDEFVVGTVIASTAVSSVVQRIRRTANFDLDWREASLEVRGSVGFVTSATYDIESIMDAADEAMYEEKGLRR